jgi:hypothetical protein
MFTVDKFKLIDGARRSPRKNGPRIQKRCTAYEGWYDFQFEIRSFRRRGTSAWKPHPGGVLKDCAVPTPNPERLGNL